MKFLPTSLLCLATALLFSAATPAQEKKTEIVVSAGASLKDAFREAAQAFESAHPQARIRFNFAASGVLVNQIEQGAPVALFAAPSVDDVRRLAKGGLVKREATFAYNSMVLVVARHAKESIRDIADLAAPSVRLVVAARYVPAGRYAGELLRNADAAGRYGPDFSQRVLAQKVSEEMDVRLVAMKVAMGEGDAAFVYQTDVTQEIRSLIHVLPLPEDLSPRIEFRMALLQAAGAQGGLANEFFLFLLSEQGQAILQRHGFQPVPGAAANSAAALHP